MDRNLAGFSGSEDSNEQLETKQLQVAFPKGSYSSQNCLILSHLTYIINNPNSGMEIWSHYFLPKAILRREQRRRVQGRTEVDCTLS